MLPPLLVGFLDDNAMAVGVEVVGRGVPGLPPNVPLLERYHFQITGLEAGTEVAFTKVVTGGAVVPEPSAIALGAIGLVGITFHRCRRNILPL